MKLLLSIFISLLISLALNAQTLQGKVVAVYDGDSLTVLGSEKIQHKIQLLKIDATEKSQMYEEEARENLLSIKLPNLQNPYLDAREKKDWMWRDTNQIESV